MWLKCITIIKSVNIYKISCRLLQALKRIIVCVTNNNVYWHICTIYLIQIVFQNNSNYTFILSNVNWHISTVGEKISIFNSSYKFKCDNSVLYSSYHHYGSCGLKLHSGILCMIIIQTISCGIFSSGEEEHQRWDIEWQNAK